MKKLSCLLISVLLILDLTACSGKETKLYAGYCTYYPDGGLMSYCEYSYEYDKDGNLTGEYEYYNSHTNTRSSKIREYDESGRIIDDYDTYVNIVRAMIGEYDITFVTDDDEYITTDSINDEEECYELLKTLREELEN